MSKIKILGATLAGALFAMLQAMPAQAQATRTWVSGVGDDANPCSRTAPCKTFAGAISKTAAGGEINCLDPGGFGAVTLTKSITLDCSATLGSILASGSNAINIPFDSFSDTFKTVRLRGLNLNGVGGSVSPGLVGISITGATNSANSRVVVEDCVIDGFTAGTARGISDTRANGGKLEITNTTIRDVGASAIVTLPSSGSVRIDVSIWNTRIYNSGNGAIAVNSGTKAMVANSVISGNGTGIDAEGANTEVSADNVTISSNTTGLFTASGGVIRLSNSNVSFNGTGINGTVNSFTNNRFVSNGAGGTISPIGTTSDPTGQQ